MSLMKIIGWNAQLENYLAGVRTPFSALLLQTAGTACVPAVFIF